MSDDKNKQSRDRNRIALGEDYEVRYWTEKLGVSREELEQAVNQVGNGAEQVREHLQQRKGPADGKGR
jgi:hypothetical protein